MMKNMGPSENKEFSQESASAQASSRLSGKGFALAAFVCAIAIALTALAVINNPGLSTIADNPNPMASGGFEDEEIGYEVVYPGEIHNDGENRVSFYASEGGTLTYAPNDYDPAFDALGQARPDAKSGVQTGLKEYKRSVAVTPFAFYGSITAVADPGYVFVGWSDGNQSSKVYVNGLMDGTRTANFEMVYESIKAPEPDINGSQNVEFHASEGGTLTYAPNDYEATTGDAGQTQQTASAGVKTGLKEHRLSVAVTPYAFYGSITAVPDPGYVFAGWSNGNKSPKIYINGLMNGTVNAYFEKTVPELITPPAPDINGSTDSIGSDAANNYSSKPPTMGVYAQNALDGNIALAQGKSVSLNGFAVLTEIGYAGTVTGKVKYETSNASLATVSDSGKVTAGKKKTGTAKITISSVDNPNCKKVVTVKVVKKSKYKAVKAINKVNLKKQYKANAAKQIAVKVTSWNPKAPSNKDFVVTVSPTSKASVDPATNKIIFKAKGTVKVTVASAENPKVKKTVTVIVN